MLRRPVYLDHNATTPLDPVVFEAMRPFFLEHFGNASSTEHSYGQQANAAIESARDQVARAVGVESKEIIFTGSCTEANNIALLGVARALDAPGHFITTAIEHPSILEVFRQIEREGHAVTYLGVDEWARISVDDLDHAIRPNTVLVSVMAANNEVGTIQPLDEIGELCKRRSILFHSDMAQTVAHDVLFLRDHGIDMASLSAQKAYGPKGVGALYIRRRRPPIRLKPIMFGGGQERSLRPGTLNTPLIVGMGAAFELVDRNRRKKSPVMQRRDRLLGALVQGISEVTLNGHATKRLSGNLSLYIKGVEPLALMRLLREQVSFSASSACATEKMVTSHVLKEMFGETDRARRSFRLSVGRFTTDEEVDNAADDIANAVNVLRAL